jgi:hypothetical protein
MYNFTNCFKIIQMTDYYIFTNEAWFHLYDFGL